MRKRWKKVGNLTPTPTSREKYPRTAPHILLGPEDNHQPSLIIIRVGHLQAAYKIIITHPTAVRPPRERQKGQLPRPLWKDSYQTSPDYYLRGSHKNGSQNNNNNYFTRPLMTVEAVELSLQFSTTRQISTNGFHQINKHKFRHLR